MLSISQSSNYYYCLEWLPTESGIEIIEFKKIKTSFNIADHNLIEDIIDNFNPTTKTESNSLSISLDINNVQISCIKIEPKIELNLPKIEGSSATLTWEGNEFALEFSYKLDYNLDDLEYVVDQPFLNWSEWDSVKVVDFQNLDDGNYTFIVKSRLDDDIEEADPFSSSFQINNISGPSLRVYPLDQMASSGDEIDVYLYFEELDADIPPLTLLDLQLTFSGTNESSPVVELNGSVENLSSAMYCETEIANPEVFLVPMPDDTSGVDLVLNISYFLPDNDMGLCETGPFIKIPIRVLAEDQWISIEITGGEFYSFENDEEKLIGIDFHNGYVSVEAVQ